MNGEGPFALSPAFWTRFHREHWERSGVVLRAPFEQPLAEPGDVFRRLVEASDHYRAGDRSLDPEFFIEHAQLRADVAVHLPSPRDASVEAWSARLTRMIDGRRFGLIVDNFEACDDPLWWRLRQFLRGLYALTGVPGNHVKTTLFLGNYGRTPFGVHRGRSGNFMFVISGRKRIRAWPDEFFRGKEDMTNRLDYDRFLGTSITLDAEPGDIIYWPSSYWHIGEDLGGWSVAISVALFMDLSPGADLVRHVAPMVADRLARTRHEVSSALPPGGPEGGARVVPELVRAAVDALRGVSRSPALAETLAASWLDHLTGYGFMRVPAPRAPRHLADDERVRGDPENPILWLPVGGRDLICSANGHSFGIPADPRVLALFERLNGGTVCRVGDLVGEGTGMVEAGGREFVASAHDIRALLERLWSLRALTECP